MVDKSVFYSIYSFMRVLLLFIFGRKSVGSITNYVAKIAVPAVLAILGAVGGAVVAKSQDATEASELAQATRERAVAIATSAFVRGACGGSLANCELTVTTKLAGEYGNDSGPVGNKYRIVLGKVFPFDASQQNVAPEPVMLGEVCTGLPGSQREEAVSCVVEALATPAAIVPQ